MATQKKKTTKKGSKSKSGSVKDGQEQGFGLIVFGYFFLLSGLVLLLGCISMAYSGPGGNWLGPYLGFSIPQFFTMLFGRVAVILFTFALMAWGLILAFEKLRGIFVRYAVGLSLLTLDISFLMALKGYGAAKVSQEVLLSNGGLVGAFFTQNVWYSIFGKASALAPFVILLFALILILVLSFGLRPRHFNFLAKGSKWMGDQFSSKKQGDYDATLYQKPESSGKSSKKGNLEYQEASVVDSRNIKGVYMDDKTVFLEPEDFKIKRKGVLAPFNGRRNWLDEKTLAATVGGNNSKDKTIQDQGLHETKMDPTQEAPTLSGEYDRKEDPEIRRLEEYLRKNIRKMNALEIVEIKDKIADLRRAGDLIAWEKEHKGRMQVKGDVRRDTPAETFASPAAAPEGKLTPSIPANQEAGSPAETVFPQSTSPQSAAPQAAALQSAAPQAAALQSAAPQAAALQSAAPQSAATTGRITVMSRNVLKKPEGEIPEEALSSGNVPSETSSQQAIDPENLLGGDGAIPFEGTSGGDPLSGDFPGADDSFAPVVYGAEGDMTQSAAPAGTSGAPSVSEGSKAAVIPPAKPSYDKYVVPEISKILDEHEPQTADYTEDELNAIGKMLEEKLENFKVKGRVIGCETGPMITRFEVEPGPGVKVSRFSALQDDLALPLKVSSVRILAPIPGKAAVGIEIPNRKFQTVFSRDVFQSEAFDPSPEKILVALGKDITGESFTMDLARAPHLLIAGQTGSGKSVCINALMASMLFSKTPDELRMILVDPKAVELKMYENIPHLLAPVITKPEIAIQALQWLCYEMDRRTEVLATAKVRNIGGFNAKYEAGELPDDIPSEDKGHRMPFIVVIIDEMADLMMVAGKEIEKSVARLAAKARAVGIHLVLATQRPSVKVITGIIKANLPTRISFKVASQIDARTVMDHAGAEKLLGRGDMLFKAVNDPDPVRVHGAFLSDEEAEKLADACSNQNVFYPQVESFDLEAVGDEDEDMGGKKLGKLDPLLFEVAQWAIESHGLSTSAVQRNFSVGFSRAGKIVDQLYGLGVCGPAKGNSKPRAVLVDMDQLMQMERSGSFRG